MREGEEMAEEGRKIRGEVGEEMGNQLRIRTGSEGREGRVRDGK